MSVRDTSKKALEKVISSGELGNMQKLVYEALFNYGPCTANELYKNLVGKKKINQANITTRLGELRAMGSVVEKDKRPCKVTKQTVLVWECTHRVPIKPAKKPTKKEEIANLKRLLKLAYGELKLIYSEDMKEEMPDFANEIRGVLK
jgi:hypothetical protein